MAAVGLIANANAARDVRRVTSLARTVDVHERTNMVARLLCGLAAGGVERTWYMREPAHVVERAFEAVVASGAPLARSITLAPIPLPAGREAVDAAGTVAAAAALAEIGVACVVSIGGDGTHRAVASGWPDAVLVPLAGGTNNAFAGPFDPTAAGLAAAVFAADLAGGARHLRRATRFEVTTGEASSIALVDVAVVRGGWIGAHAIWRPDLLLEAVVARCDPTITGLAGVAGMVHLLEPPEAGLHLRFGQPGDEILAPLGPGQLVSINLRSYRTLRVGHRVTIGPFNVAPRRTANPSGAADEPSDDATVTLAFDGEREVVLPAGRTADVHLVADGPWVLDMRSILEAAVRGGAFGWAGRPGGTEATDPTRDADAATRHRLAPIAARPDRPHAGTREEV